MTQEDKLRQVANAVTNVTGIPFNKWASESRKAEYVFARMLFASHAFKAGCKMSNIARYIYRDRTTIVHCLVKFDDEYQFNKDFREQSEQVNKLLTKEE